MPDISHTKINHRNLRYLPSVRYHSTSCYMKIFRIFLLVTLGFVLITWISGQHARMPLPFPAMRTIPEPEQVEVSGTATYTRSYCGGAYPSDEILQELQQPIPWHTTFYFRKGLRNDKNVPLADSATTDANGHFSVSLKPGTYVMLYDWQRDQQIFYSKKLHGDLQVDYVCLENAWRQGIQIITVGDTPIRNLDIQVHKPCFQPMTIPCIQYTGPFPP